MKFIIKKEIFNRFDDILTGVIIAKNIDNHGESIEISQLLREIEEKTKQDCSQLESTTKHPNIIPWRAAYKNFGTDPHEYRCSSEALLKRVLKGNEIWKINKLVDLYNYISLKYITPVGGEDLDKTKGDVYLDFAKGDEQFIRLGGTENEPPLVGEVVYKDELGVLCRRWNWREADRTKLTEETKNAILVIEGLSPVDRDKLELAAQELKDLIEKFCDGEVSYRILDKDQNEIQF